MALPLIVGYEILMFLSGSNMRNLPAQWLQRSLNSAWGNLGFVIAVIAVGVVVFVREKEKELPFRPHYFGFMLCESVLWVPVFAITAIYLTSHSIPASAAIVATTEPGAVGSFLANLGMSLGAGVYEEFVFRVCLFGCMVWIGGAAFPKDKIPVYFCSATISALIFSGAHYIGHKYDIQSFVFRAFAGLILNVIFLCRGFGIAAWTHAIYDILVLTHPDG